MAMWAGVQGQMWADEARRIEEARQRGGDEAAAAEKRLIKEENRRIWREMGTDAAGGAASSMVKGGDPGTGALVGLIFGTAKRILSK